MGAVDVQQKWNQWKIPCNHMTYGYKNSLYKYIYRYIGTGA